MELQHIQTIFFPCCNTIHVNVFKDQSDLVKVRKFYSIEESKKARCKVAYTVVHDFSVVKLVWKNDMEINQKPNN